MEAQSQPTQLSFVSLQVRDLAASRMFYQEVLGFESAPTQSPVAHVFQDQGGAIFAIRTPMVNLDAVPQLGWGTALWFSVADLAQLHDKLRGQATIVQEMTDTPFGKTFVVADPDGYRLTFQQRAA